jgi:hypothetical protein
MTIETVARSMSGARSTPTQVPDDVERRLEQHRVELTAYAYRMLGSAFEAEDAVQETMLRAWRAVERFEDVRRSGPGSIGSPPTCASTCSEGRSAGHGRWTSHRRRRRTRPSDRPCRSPPG